jgi:chemotaxis protein CheD
VKLFGGGAVLDFDMNQIGNQNIACARKYVRTHSLNVVAEDLGGEWPRKVVYEPRTGRVQLRRMRRLQSATIASNEQALIRGLDR